MVVRSLPGAYSLNEAEWLAEKEGPDAERTGLIRAGGGVLREFQTWLKQEDASFGDLRRMLNKRQ